MHHEFSELSKKACELTSSSNNNSSIMYPSALQFQLSLPSCLSNSAANHDLQSANNNKYSDVEPDDNLIYNLHMINNNNNIIHNNNSNNANNNSNAQGSSNNMLLPLHNEVMAAAAMNTMSGGSLQTPTTYFNLLPLSYASSTANFYHQTDGLSVPVMVESNAESSDFNELLNCLRGENEISIENDNLFIFNSKY